MEKSSIFFKKGLDKQGNKIYILANKKSHILKKEVTRSLAKRDYARRN
jgi:hypothetical protein